MLFLQLAFLHRFLPNFRASVKVVVVIRLEGRKPATAAEQRLTVAPKPARAEQTAMQTAEQAESRFTAVKAPRPYTVKGPTAGKKPGQVFAATVVVRCTGRAVVGRFGRNSVVGFAGGRGAGAAARAAAGASRSLGLPAVGARIIVGVGFLAVRTGLVAGVAIVGFVGSSVVVTFGGLVATLLSFSAFPITLKSEPGFPSAFSPLLKFIAIFVSTLLSENLPLNFLFQVPSPFS